MQLLANMVSIFNHNSIHLQLMAYMVPIPLAVTIEMIKIINGLYMSW